MSVERQIGEATGSPVCTPEEEGAWENYCEPPPKWKVAADDDRRREAHVPSVRRVEFCTEEAYQDNGDDEFHPALVKVGCPACGRKCAPLISTRTRLLRNGWRWVGLDYQEPCSDWLCICRGCGADYILTTHTPQ